jgi:ribosomal protein L11 methyltransferase
MKQARLFQLSITTRSEAEEAFTELLQRLFDRPATAYTDFARGKTVVSIYLDKPSQFSAASRKHLLAGIRVIQQAGLEVGPCTIKFAAMPAKNWAESWKRHFFPLSIGGRLLLKPSWSARCPRKGQSVIVLDPGLSFGTGHHPTTAYCLRQLVRQRDPARKQSCLDLGTGSGILAIAAAKLGYEPVHAIDSDPEAVRLARLNAGKNGETRIRFRRAEVAQLRLKVNKKYSLICANLISTVILAERRRLVAQLEEDGVLIVAGILKTEFGKLRREFERMGLRVMRAKTEREWRSGALCWG